MFICCCCLTSCNNILKYLTILDDFIKVIKFLEDEIGYDYSQNKTTFTMGVKAINQKMVW